MRRFLCLLLCLSFLIFPVKAAETPKYVALTFDDGPSGRFTRALLDGLKERRVKATFLLCGYRIAQEPEEVRRIYEEGHEIGLHGYSHSCMTQMSPEKILQELEMTRALLPEGCQPVFFRPPGGQTSASVKQAARQAGLAILHWSVDPRDWAVHDAGKVEAAVLETVKDGDVVLLHDMSESSVEATLRLVEILQARGFTLVTASELAALRGYGLEVGQVYRRFPPTQAVSQKALPGKHVQTWREIRLMLGKNYDIIE